MLAPFEAVVGDSGAREAVGEKVAVLSLGGDMVVERCVRLFEVSFGPVERFGRGGASVEELREVTEAEGEPLEEAALDSSPLVFTSFRLETRDRSDLAI
jgi:hypothetical protein